MSTDQPRFEDESTDGIESPRGGGGRLWRSIWRTHFYAGVVAGPMLIWFAITGLVILYTDPVQELLSRDLTVVEPGAVPLSLDEQLARVEGEYPDLALWTVTPGKEPDRSTRFTMGDADDTGWEVYVDQYSGEVLGRMESGGDLVGFANETHGSILPRGWTMPMPMLSGLLGDDDVFHEVEIGEVLVEIFAGWGLVLAASGAFLWWPRRGSKQARFVPRRGTTGRARLRDLHAVGGSVLAVMLMFFAITGLPWSSVWGSNWAWMASELTPNEQNFWEWEGPASALPQTGDLDRYGVRIPWAVSADPVAPSSEGDEEAHHGGAAGPTEGGLPAEPVSLDTAYRAAVDEGMLPGFSITPAFNDFSDPSAPILGSVVVINPWPSTLGEQRALYLDQFSGDTLAISDVETWGTIQRVTELGVQTHMGTQLGWFTTALMTLACLLVFWNVGTALMMWNRRRRKGTLGVPRRPLDPAMERRVGVTALVLAVIYPLWGASMLAVIALDKWVVRRVPRLRAAFGMSG